MSEEHPILSRTGDPVTSHLAAKKLVETGKWQSQKHWVLAWMTHLRMTDDRHSLTAHELARESGIPHPVCHKRLPDLEKACWVRKAVKRDCTVTGEPAWTWRLLSTEERQEALSWRGLAPADDKLDFAGE